MRGNIDKDGGGTPRGNACVAEAKDACGLLGSGPSADGGKLLAVGVPNRLKGMV